VHELSTGLLSNVDGESRYVRVTVLTSAGRLDRERQLALVQQFTDVVVAALRSLLIWGQESRAT
jgi:hypothetical protein